MALTKTANANAWFEKGGTDDALPAPAFLQESGGEYALATTGAKDARLLDWHGDRAEYEMILTDTPYVIVDIGGGVLQPASSGTPAAILIDDNGGLVASTDLTGTEAGRYYAAANGSIVAVRFDAPEVAFLNVGTTYTAFEAS